MPVVELVSNLFPLFQRMLYQGFTMKPHFETDQRLCAIPESWWRPDPAT